MKFFRALIIVLLLFLVLAGAGLQIFLTRGLPAALNNGVFPAVRSMYGLDMSISGASVNILKGTVSLDDFTVRNLRGYDEPYILSFDECRLHIEMISLLKRDPVIVRELRADGVALSVERNRKGDFNVIELAQALKPLEPAKLPPAPVPERREEQIPRPGRRPPAPEPDVAAEIAVKEPVPVHLRRLAVNIRLTYTDPQLDRPLPLDLRLTGSDLFTVPAEGQPNSLLVLRGSLVDDRTAFATDLNAIVSPLTDPEKPTFNATGSILDIRADLLGDLLKKNNLESPSFSIQPSILCNRGVLNGSFIDLTLADLKLYGAVIGDTVLRVPINGTLERPVIDITGVLQSLFSEQAVNIGRAIGMRELRRRLGAEEEAPVTDAVRTALTDQIEKTGILPPLQDLAGQILPGEKPAPEADAPETPPVKALEQVIGRELEKTDGADEIKDALKNLRNTLFGR